jgi:hypothetical protein
MDTLMGFVVIVDWLVYWGLSLFLGGGLVGASAGFTSDTIFWLCPIKSDVIQNKPVSASLCEMP